MTELAAILPGRDGSPKTIARLIGVLTLLTVIAGVYALIYVGDRLIVWRDPVVTASNILAHRTLYVSAVAVFLVESALSVATTALFYVLLVPAGRSLALVALCLGMLGNAIKTFARVLFAAPLYVLESTRFQSLSPETLGDLSLLLLLINDKAAGIAMAFFGFQALFAGCLMLRSTFLPRFLGVLSIVGGLSWLTALWPPLATRLGMFDLLVGLVGILAQIVWLTLFGVDERRWHEQARASRRVR